MSLEDAPTGAFKKARRQSNARYTYRFSGKLQWLAGNKGRAAERRTSKMAVGAPFQHDFPALPVEELRGRGCPRPPCRWNSPLRRHAARPARTPRRDLRRPCTGSHNRRRRRSMLRCRQCRATADRAAADSGIDSRSIAAETPETPHSLARSPASPSDTSIAALAWSRTIAAKRRARLRHAIAPDQRRRARPHRRARHGPSPPLRTASPSAASPIVPVTTTRSPGLAPLR